jgi:hypothetical protein
VRLLPRLAGSLDPPIRAASGCLGTVDEGWVRAFSGQAFERRLLRPDFLLPYRSEPKDINAQAQNLSVRVPLASKMSFQTSQLHGSIVWGRSVLEGSSDGHDPFILLLGKTILPHRRTEAGSTSAPFLTSCRPTTTCGPKIGCRPAAVACFVF